MPTERLEVSTGEDLLEYLVVLEFRNLIISSVDCTFTGEAVAVICLLSSVQLGVVLVAVLVK